MRRIGTTWTVAPAPSSSARSGGSAGTATWADTSGVRLRTSRSRAWSDPPRSETGWTYRMVGVQVAMNLEQLFQPSPGGIGRYSARLAAHLPAADGETIVLTVQAGAVTMTARGFEERLLEPPESPG